MTGTNDKDAPGKGAPKKPARGHSNSAHAQRQRLLAWLRQHGQIDTITARRELDCLMPAARVLELRRRDFEIATVWIERATDCGKLHRVALYILKPGGSHE